MNRILVVSCEHGGRAVPDPYRKRLGRDPALLRSHRGSDPGAFRLAEEIAGRHGAPLIACRTTRLLVDPNRDEDSPTLFSPDALALDPEERETLIAALYEPYRAAVDAAVRRALDAGRGVLYLAVHSFAAELDGRRRDLDVGLLHDPARPREVEFCTAWREALGWRAPDLRVQLNRPYSGTDEGLDRTLRSRYETPRFLGVTLEVNQARVQGPAPEWRRLRRLLVETLSLADS